MVRMRWVLGMAVGLVLGLVGAAAGQQRGDDIHPRPSVDGSRVVFYAVTFGPYSSRVFSVAPDGSDLQSHSSPNMAISNPELLPDGDLLATARVDGSWDLVVLGPDGEVRRQLTHSPELGEFHPSLMPDGMHVSFARSEDGGPGRIYRVPLAGGTPEVVLEWPEPVFHPKWSRDGGTLLFDSMGTLYVHDVASGSTRELAADDDYMFAVPCLSPDGSTVVFSGSRAGEDDWRALTLWVVNVDGTGRRRISPDGARWGTACWTPDGERILFSRMDEPPSRIWSVRPDGTDARPLGH